MRYERNIWKKHKENGNKKIKANIIKEDAGNIVKAIPIFS